MTDVSVSCVNRYATEMKKLLGQEADGRFGNSVAVSGNYAIVGANWNDGADGNFIIDIWVIFICMYKNSGL